MKQFLFLRGWTGVDENVIQNNVLYQRIQDLENQLAEWRRTDTGQVFQRETIVPAELIGNQRFREAEVRNFAEEIGRQLITIENVIQEVYEDYQGNIRYRLRYRL